MRAKDTVIVWQLDRLGGNRKHLVTTVQELAQRRAGLRVLASPRAVWRK
ncbi:MAG: hypothetical protein GKR94_14525 [Gammaproteobacteria bacterium]|nr:hypothetical protein [Gammaproteobacteria bacterium]